jgi:hypothetical protein
MCISFKWQNPNLKGHVEMFGRVVSNGNIKAYRRESTRRNKFTTQKLALEESDERNKFTLQGLP